MLQHSPTYQGGLCCLYWNAADARINEREEITLAASPFCWIVYWIISLNLIEFLLTIVLRTDEKEVYVVEMVYE